MTSSRRLTATSASRSPSAVPSRTGRKSSTWSASGPSSRSCMRLRISSAALRSRVGRYVTEWMRTLPCGMADTTRRPLKPPEASALRSSRPKSLRRVEHVVTGRQRHRGPAAHGGHAARVRVDLHEMDGVARHVQARSRRSARGRIRQRSSRRAQKRAHADSSSSCAEGGAIVSPSRRRRCFSAYSASSARR